MSDANFPLTHHAVNALAPDADRFNSNPATDVYSLAEYERITFVLAKGAGATGTATLTVESCDDVTPTTTTAVAFSYRAQTSNDTWGAWTAATSSGFTTTAGANQVYEVTISGSELNDDDKYVRLQLTEVANDPVDAGVLAILTQPRYGASVPQTAIV